MDKVNRHLLEDAEEFLGWERLRARSKGNAPMPVRGEWSVTDQVLQEPPGVNDVLTMLSCQSIPPGAEASRVVDSASTILEVRRWERFGARPRDSAPMQRVPMEWSSVKEVRQEPHGVYNVMRRRRCQDVTEDDESTLQRAASIRAADCNSGRYHEDETSLPVPLPSATLPASIDDCICESLGTTNNSRLASRESITQLRVVQGIARVQAQIQREREEQETR